MGSFEKKEGDARQCPACWSKLSPEDTVCGECGEVLSGSDSSTEEMDGAISDWMDYLGAGDEAGDEVGEGQDADMEFLKQDDQIRELLDDIQTKQEEAPQIARQVEDVREKVSFTPQTKQTGNDWETLEKRLESLAVDLENGIRAGIDTMYLERLFERAKEEYENGLLDECRKTLRICQEELRNRLLKHRMLMDILHTVQEKIAEASKHGLKVEKAIGLLRRAKEEKANGDVENAMHFAMKSSEELDRLLQDTSWKVEIDDFLH